MTKRSWVDCEKSTIDTVAQKYIEKIETCLSWLQTNSKL